MIHEHVVLFRVQHLEKRRRGIAPEIHGHLVHFVQHEHRIPRARLAHHLDDLARQRADIRASVPADLSLVPHAAKREADELPPGGLGDRHPQRRLAHARRAHKAQNGTARVLHQPPHRQEFQDPLFDLLEAVVIGFQHFLGELQVADLLRLLLPRHRQQPFQVVARDRGLGRHRRHVLQPLQLRDRLLEGVLGHPRGLNLLLQLIDLALLAAAQFLLDGLDLLVEVVFLLRALHLPLHAALDGAVDVQLFDLDVKQFGDSCQPLDGIEDFQQLLLLFDGELQIGADRVRQLPRIVHPDRRDHGLVVQVLAELDVLFEKRGDARNQRFQLRPRVHLVVRYFHHRPEKAFVVGDRDDLAPLDAFHQDLNVPVRQAQALHDVDDRPDAVDLLRPRLVCRGVVLRGQEDPFVPSQRLLQRAHARVAPHHERSHHVREDNHVPHRHHRQTS